MTTQAHEYGTHGTTHGRAHAKSGRAKARRKGRTGKGPVARVTDAAEKIHRSVAGFPLDVLEQVDSLAKPVQRVRKLQDRSITATYEMVRGVQAEVKRLVRAERAERRRATKPKARRAHPKPRPQASHAAAAAG
jgi:hypothetical protein